MKDQGIFARTAGAVALVTILTGCASGPQLGQLGPDALFERGMAELGEEDWTSALLAFERLVLEFPTHGRVEAARFHMGEAYFGKKEYVTAAGEFARFATDYARSELADDARFRVCQAYVELSPIVQRDQEYTRAAIEHCQSLVTYYPSSEFVPEAERIVAVMTDKLAAKVYENAEFYQKNKAYDSAIIYYEDVLVQYPRSSIAPRALLRLVEVYTQIGYEEEAQEARDRLLRDYPDTAEARQIQETALARRP